MNIKPGFELRDICGENIIIAHGLENIDFTKIIRFNETAAYLWRTLHRATTPSAPGELPPASPPFTVEDMVQALLAEYDVDEPTARADCERILRQWTEAGFIEP